MLRRLRTRRRAGGAAALGLSWAVLTAAAPAPGTTAPTAGAATAPAATQPAPPSPEVVAAVDVILGRYVRSLLPPAEADARELAERAADLARTLGDDGRWADVAYDDASPMTWKAKEHLERTLVLSKAYRQGRDRGGPDPSLRHAAQRALRLWLDRDFRNRNWWWNEIGTPQLVGENLALLRPEVAPDDLESGLAIMRRNTWAKHAGANLVWGVNLQILRECLRPTADSDRLLDEAHARLYREIHVAKPGHEGIQPDLSFHQHGPQFYSGGYGLVFGNDVARSIAFAWGTRYQVPPGAMELFASFLLDGQQWMVRRDVFDYSAVGREITREGKAAVLRSWLGGPIAPTGAAYGLLNAVEMLAGLPVPRRAEFAAFAARLRGDAGAPPLSGNRCFWASDYVAHHRPGYFTSVKMFSSRTFNTENTGGEGRNNHHLADGANFVYRDGGEYRDVFPVWDWDRVPGVTAELGFREANPKENYVRGSTGFVGGVSDGTYGLAAMHLRRGPLGARKAWAMLDGRTVCLGAGIGCDSDNRVLTSVNQCLLRGEVRTPGGVLPPGNRELPGTPWVHHDGVGYVFPGGGRGPTLRVEAAERAGQWSDIGAGRPSEVRRPVFGLWLDHGPRVRDGGYQYLVLPGATAEETAAAAVEPPVRVLSNTPTIQAVLQPRPGVLAVAFHQAGEVDGGPGWRLSVDRPCLVLLTEVRGPGEDRPTVLRLAVANPEQQPVTVDVRLDRAVRGPGGTPLPGGGTSVRVTTPEGPRAGASVVTELRAP